MQTSCIRSGAILLLCLVCVTDTNGAQPDPGRATPLFDDLRFERGFVVWSPEPGRHVQDGLVQSLGTTSEPVWGLAQWHSRFSLGQAQPERRSDGSVRFFDGAKSVTFFPAGAAADLALALGGNTEYSGKAPQPGDPWPHLLIERSLLAHPAITELLSVRFQIRFRLVKADVHRPDGFDARRHTAQFLFYLTVQNRNRESPGFGDYFWFGVPMYDTRFRIPRAHKALDKASKKKPGTGKFIFNPSGNRYTTQSAHDRQWITIDKNLLPLIREGLETAWQRGYLQDSHNPSDYRLSSMNLGWEVTGPLDVEVHIQGLRLEAIEGYPQRGRRHEDSSPRGNVESGYNPIAFAPMVMLGEAIR